MYLEHIEGPDDIRSLDYEKLEVLATEIREFLVDAVATHGGHLGSNLGVVELTIALHRVFESPRDVILWDTGHQAYVHKIVTGRREGFDHLREEGGLSGYPSRSESVHDVIENSHASTVLSYAYGIATARELHDTGEGHGHVVAVIGDGAMTGGMAFEGLNNLGHSGRDVTIVLNDNGRSYAPTVSKLSESLMSIRANPVYMKRQKRFEAVAQKAPIVGRILGRTINATKAGIREMWAPPAFFEDLGLRYLGPYDGHDVEAVESALTSAKEFAGPVVVHVLTQKGRGHAPAENDSVKLMHDTGSIKPGSFTEAFADSLVKLGEVHPQLVAITAAMPDSTGVLDFSDRFPDRCFDVGIAEQHAVASAAGMAMEGLVPVVALYSTFLTRAIDQVNLDVGLHGEHVIFCLDRAGVTGDDGPSHHGLLDMVLCMKVPGMTVMAPSSYQEIEVMLAAAIDLCDGPVSIRWPKTPAETVPEDQVGAGLDARRARIGNGRVCFIGVGKMFNACLRAAELLEAEGIDATVWDPRIVKPLDTKMLDDAAGNDVVVSVEDGFREGGVGTAVHLALRDLDSRAQVEILGVPIDYFQHAKPDVILHRLGLDAEGIAASTLRALSKI
ncbi:MAG: 1-deoxy-D-xylulose-5-phosphate synthase [Acidobacteria bacterium]|nr:MAG: 1-deoxy-D-xylulose-5-phosphate synthase [Acidobacteriota bacterium]